MLNRISVILVVLILLLIGTPRVFAEVSDDILEGHSPEELLEELPESSREAIFELGLDSFNPSKLNELSFEDFLGSFLNAAGAEVKAPLAAFASVAAIMLLYSILYGVKNSLESSSMQQVLSVCVTLCLTCVLISPISDVVGSAVNTICSASDFMLAYIPIMLAVMTASGQAVSGGSYYALMVFAGQGIGGLCSKVISPFLRLFLGLSIASAVAPGINLSSLIKGISRLTKWLLGLSMTVFSAMLGFKQLIGAGLDSASTRAVKFTVTSFVPVVGSALSEALRTVQASVGLLKSGVGIFAIIGVAVCFLPVLAQCFLWQLCINLSKALAEILGLREPCALLDGAGTVVGTLLGVLLCVMSVYIISTAMVLMLGGSV